MAPESANRVKRTAVIWRRMDDSSSKTDNSTNSRRRSFNPLIFGTMSAVLSNRHCSAASWPLALCFLVKGLVWLGIGGGVLRFARFGD